MRRHLIARRRWRARAGAAGRATTRALRHKRQPAARAGVVARHIFTRNHRALRSQPRLAYRRYRIISSSLPRNARFGGAPRVRA